MYDVAIYDSVGLAVSHKLYDVQGLGGSEFQQLLLAESLAENGYKVIYLSKNPSIYHQQYPIGKIDYCPLNTEFETKNLILVRTSQYDFLKKNYEKIFVYAHDTNHSQIYPNAHMALFQSREAQATLVCVSEWQQKLFEPLHWKSTVVSNSIPDWVYDFQAPKKKQFIYASAVWKGLPESIKIFQQIKQNKPFTNHKFKILNPGYDGFDGNHLSNPDIEWVGAVKFKDVVKHIAESECLLYYNTMAETFGIVPLLAAILKSNPAVYQADRTFGSGGALAEIIGTKFAKDNFPEFINTIFNPPPSFENWVSFKQSMVFEEHWKPLLEL